MNYRQEWLVLDINIPGGNNLQMIDAVRLRQPRIKILIFSGYEEQLFALNYIQAGADGYLVKHSSEEDIKSALKAVRGIQSLPQRRNTVYSLRSGVPSSVPAIPSQ